MVQRTHTIGHLNIHNNRRALAAALAWGTDSLSLNEAGKVRRPLNRDRRTHTFAVPGVHREPKRTSLATAMAYDRSLAPTLGFGQLLAEWSTPERIAPARWCYGVGFQSGIMHMSFHNHAVVDGKSRSVDRVAKHAEALGDLMDLWNMYERRFGYDVVLTGDINERDAADSPDWRDAGERFRRRGLEFRNFGLDWLVWNPRHLEMRNIKRVPRKRLHTDHDGIIATAVQK